jgi:hypothetical protein
MEYAISPRAPPIKTDGKIAKPSRPSVKFTALDEPTRTNIPVKINKNGDIGIIASLKNGTIKEVSGGISAEKYKYVIASNAMNDWKNIFCLDESPSELLSFIFK